MLLQSYYLFYYTVVTGLLLTELTIIAKYLSIVNRHHGLPEDGRDCNIAAQT